MALLVIQSLIRPPHSKVGGTPAGAPDTIELLGSTRKASAAVGGAL